MIFQELDPSIKRAYEIALAGGYSMCLMGNITLRPLIQEIKSLLPEVKHTTPEEADLIIEVTNQDADYKRANRGEDKADLIQRIQSMTKIETYEPDDVHKTLMKVAYRKLDLTPIDVDKINQIAITIAELERCAKVETVHLAEAVHYRAINIKATHISSAWIEIEPNEVAGYPEDKVISIQGTYLAKVFAGQIFIID